MATQQFGYGPNVWAPAKGVGAVEMPILSAAPAVAPKFKPKNEYAGYAAKMIGELAYGAMAEGMAPQYSGFNELLQKDVYTRQPGSAQFAGPDGWIKPENSLWASEVEELELAEHIKRREAAAEFSEKPLGDFTPQPLTFAESKKQQEIAALPRPLTSAQAVEFEGFDPSLVPDVPTVPVIQELPDELALGDPNQKPIWDDWDNLKIDTYIGAQLRKISPSIINDFGFLKSNMPDWLSDKDITIERDRLEVVKQWVGANGGNNAYSYFKNLPNWYQELEAFKGNPIDYYYNKIAPTLGD